MESSRVFCHIKNYASRKNLPLIPIRADNVSILSEPSLFYHTILERIRDAKRRVILSALYIGVGPKEKALVELLADKLHQSKDFQLNVCLDAHRATRLNHDGTSSTSMLQNVLSHEKADLKLINTNSRTMKLSRVLGRFGELISTYHSKFLVFDNDVILTGANLSSIYFEKRQDRYMLIKSSKMISDYIHRLVDSIQMPNLRKSIEDLNEDFKNPNDHSSALNQDCYIIPLFQLKACGLNQSDDFLEFLNSILPDSREIYLSTGYFNPSEAIDSLNVGSIIAPSEEANGFHKGGGLLKLVPRLYTALQNDYMNNHKYCKFSLYKRSGWSFHAKGMWIRGVDNIYIHLMGSSNFNHRSSHRDFEAQFLVLTTNKSLIQDLESERSRLWAQTEELETKHITKLDGIYRAMARLLKSFL